MNNWNDRISPAVNSIPPSGIRRFFDIVAEMKDVVSLGIGEPDFVTPWHIRESCISGLQKGYTAYTSNSGLLELREEIAKHFKCKYDVTYNPANEALITVGVSEALDLAIRAILSPGDEVLIPEPCYVSYKACVIMAGGCTCFGVNKDGRRVSRYGKTTGRKDYSTNEGSFNWLPE